MIYKALNNAETSSLQLHTKFQKSVRPSWRVDTSFSSFLHPWAHAARQGPEGDNAVTSGHHHQFLFCNLSHHRKMLWLEQ